MQRLSRESRAECALHCAEMRRTAVVMQNLRETAADWGGSTIKDLVTTKTIQTHGTSREGYLMQRETTNTLDRSTQQFVFALQGALRRRGAGLALWGTSWAEAARLGFSFAREDAGGFIIN